jgi:hypothetical protein
MLRSALRRVGLAVALVLSVAAVSARAQVLLEDDFSVLDAGLANGEIVGVEDNTLYIDLTAEHWWDPLYQSVLFENVDASVKARVPDPQGEMGHMAGLVFWALHADEFYVLQISDSGTFAVARATPERWSYPISWRETDALKVEPGEWNELRVVTLGRKATVYINDKEVGSFKGRPPEGGSLIGFYGQVGSEDARIEFSDFKAVTPAEVPDKEDVDPSVILADNFEMLDPGWGSETGWFGVKDGAMFIQFDPNQSFMPVYAADVVEDVDITVKVKSSIPDGGLNSGRAIAFWVVDPSEDFWLFEIYDNKNVAVFRRVKDRWLKPMSPKQAPNADDIDLAGGNTELRVVIQGRKVTCYVNGVDCGTIQGQPPEGGSYFGLYGESDATAVTHMFYDFQARIP